MTSEIREIVAWLGVLGIPSIFMMTTWCVKRCVCFTKQLTILANAQKAQMRSQLLNQYYKHKSAGYISADDLDDWENQYKAYHNLVGDNGVLDARRNELIAMPSVPN